ncbi:MAG: ABC transporter substrate-binding protein [Oscillospiraceae bacterium]|nr:ABC transporter substrate-binding protein [Oscillospiraceae bacterium]
MKNKIAAIMLTAVLLLAFCGCSAENGGEMAEDAVTFTDALGREVSVRRSPKRVAALIGSFADVWVLAGGSICAAAEDAWEDFGMEAEDAVNIGGAHSPSLELLLSAEPEFVIASASTAADVEMLDSLESAGIPVAYFDVDNFGDYLQMLDICTDITGRKDLYEQNGTAVQKEITELKEEFAKANLTEREKTVLLVRVSSGSIKAKGSEGTVLGEMLADMGCINIADSQTALLETLNAESIIGCEPYRIFAVTMGSDSQKATDNLNRMLEDNPAWGSLEAVEQGRVHLMERELFNLKPNKRWAEAYEKLMGVLLEK